MQHRAPLAALEDRYGKVGTEIEENERRLGALEGARVEIRRERDEIAARLDAQEPKTPLFAKLKIASPCTASWEKMTGDAKVRFCGECKKNVYNVTEMTRREAEALLQKNAGGDMCVRFFERLDGTILTADCPVGVKRKERRKLALAVIGGTAMWGATVAAAASLVSAAFRDDAVAPPFESEMTQVTPVPVAPVAPGHLRVYGESGSPVSVDGELVAILPAATFTLRPGRHVVRMAHADGNGAEERVIFVASGALVEVSQTPRSVPTIPTSNGHFAAGGIRRAPVTPVNPVNPVDRF